MSNYHVMEKGPFTLVAGANLAANTLVTVTTAGKAGPLGAAGIPIGWVDQAYSTGATVTVLPFTGIVLLDPSADIAAGDLVKSAADGKVAPEATVTTLTVNTIGIALNAADESDGDLVHVFCY